MGKVLDFSQFGGAVVLEKGASRYHLSGRDC